MKMRILSPKFRKRTRKPVYKLPKVFVCSYEAAYIIKALGLEKTWDRVLPVSFLPIDGNKMGMVFADDAHNGEAVRSKSEDRTAAHPLNACAVNQVRPSAIINSSTNAPRKETERGIANALQPSRESEPSNFISGSKRRVPWEVWKRIYGEVGEYLRLNEQYNRIAARKKS